MKKLNRGVYKNGPLNQKLRQLYTLKQQLNNAYGHAIAKLEKSGLSDAYVGFDLTSLRKRKENDLIAIDCLINLCWRKSYANEHGYEILNRQ